MTSLRTLTGILLACSVVGCMSTTPSPLSIDSGGLRSLTGARCFALYGPDRSVAALRSELRKRLPNAEFVSTDKADVIIVFDGNTPTTCVDCGERWSPGLFPLRVAYASIERPQCATECSGSSMKATWSSESYSVRGNATALVALLYPYLAERGRSPCRCGQRMYIFNCDEEAANLGACSGRLSHPGPVVLRQLLISSAFEALGGRR